MIISLRLSADMCGNGSGDGVGKEGKGGNPGLVSVCANVLFLHVLNLYLAYKLFHVRKYTPLEPFCDIFQETFIFEFLARKIGR